MPEHVSDNLDQARGPTVEVYAACIVYRSNLVLLSCCGYPEIFGFVSVAGPIPLGPCRISWILLSEKQVSHDFANRSSVYRLVLWLTRISMPTVAGLSAIAEG